MTLFALLATASLIVAMGLLAFSMGVRAPGGEDKGSYRVYAALAFVIALFFGYLALSTLEIRVIQ